MGHNYMRTSFPTSISGDINNKCTVLIGLFDAWRTWYTSVVSKINESVVTETLPLQMERHASYQ